LGTLGFRIIRYVRDGRMDGRLLPPSGPYVRGYNKLVICFVAAMVVADMVAPQQHVAEMSIAAIC